MTPFVVLSATAMSLCFSVTLKAQAGTTVLPAAQSATVPLKEVSGLSFFDGSIFAVGDRTHQIFELPLSNKGEVLIDQIRSVDFHQKIPGASGLSSSQWEAIQMDQSGLAVVLSESPARLVILKPRGSEFVRSIALRVPAENPFYTSWESDPSSGGEGLLLLEGGFLLIAKEKNPSALLLFGPSKSKLPSTVQVLRAKSWPLPEAPELDLLWSWTPTENATLQLPDLSELALSPQQEILILSDESRKFCSVFKGLSFSEKHFDTKECFSLEKKMKNPEGLAYKGLHAIVGIDNTAKKPNIFLLAPHPKSGPQGSP